MDWKINIPIPEVECLVVDSTTGKFYKTTEEKLLQAMKELNELILEKSQITIHELHEIMTQDWPEDERAKFFERFNSHCGWAINEEKLSELQLNGTLTDDGNLLVRWDYDRL